MPTQNKIEKQIKLNFAANAEVPVHFVNTVNVLAGAEEFYLTLGTTMPLEVQNIEELEGIDTIEARTYFRCAVTKSVLRQIIDVMENVYLQYSQQIGDSDQSQK